jgi:hypothetical protein
MTMHSPRFEPPPPEFLCNHEGRPRRVGVEIEFAAVTAREAAERVQELFGGKLVPQGKHRYDVTGSSLGDFRCELDFQYAHPPDGETDADDNPELLADFRRSMREFLGDISAVMAPCEVACPPVALEDLPRLEQLREALRRSGAEGTGTGLIYAFGVQLNPDIVSREADYVTSMLKAYLLLSDWLRAQIQVDITRTLLAFADPFPPDYAALVLDGDYWPETGDLIDHYLAHNPTRNRELDMLPLFDWLDSKRVRAAVADSRIKPRPTFHYRLPNARIDQPDWTLASEWNRWCRVEHLAADRGRLDAAAAAYLRNRGLFAAEPWEREVGRFIEAS